MRVTLHTLAVLRPMEELGQPDVLVDRVWISSIHLGSWHVHHDCKIRKKQYHDHAEQYGNYANLLGPALHPLVEGVDALGTCGCIDLLAECKSYHEGCGHLQQWATHVCMSTD